MEYREYAAPPALRRHVQCVWRLHDGAPPAGVRTIYPDGRCEIIAHLGQLPLAWLAQGGWRRQPRLLFVAQLRAAIRLVYEGELRALGVRLRPAASAALAAGPGRWRDSALDLTGIDPGFAERFAAAAARFGDDAGGEALWRLLESRLRAHAIDERIEAAVTALEAEQGDIRVDTLAARAGLSMRAFQTKFLDCVGLGAKEFARLVRLQATIRALDAGDHGLSRVAHEAGFSDQAHATRELTRLTGLTPARLRAALRGDRDGDDTVHLAAAFVRGRAGRAPGE